MRNFLTVSQRLFPVVRDSVLLWDVQSFVNQRYSLWTSLFQTWMQNSVFRCVLRLQDCMRDLGATIIYVTHDQTEAMTLGTRIVVMKDGVVQQVAYTYQNLYTKPCNLFVAGFIGSPQMNFLDAEVKVNGSDVTLSVGGHELPVPADKKQALIDKGYAGKTVILGIRPEDVHVAATFTGENAGTVHSTINVYELLGAEVFLYFDAAGTQVTARVGSGNRAQKRR